MRLNRLIVRRLELPLRVPYKLALGAVRAFHTIIVEARGGGRTGWGEATILTGYTAETVDGACSLLRTLGCGRAVLRLDGNQGYGRDAAPGFVNTLDPEGIELLERPFAAANRDAAKALAALTRIAWSFPEACH